VPRQTPSTLLISVSVSVFRLTFSRFRAIGRVVHLLALALIVAIGRDFARSFGGAGQPCVCRIRRRFGCRFLGRLCSTSFFGWLRFGRVCLCRLAGRLFIRLRGISGFVGWCFVLRLVPAHRRFSRIQRHGGAGRAEHLADLGLWRIVPVSIEGCAGAVCPAVNECRH
jgi:hypothetical protein